MSRKKPGISEHLIPSLQAYPFPGNIRELKAMVFDAVSRCTGSELGIDHFSDHLGPSPVMDNQTGGHAPHTFETMVFPETLPTIREMTERLVNEAMKRANGKQTLAARMLGISQPALNQRLKNKP